MVVLDTAYLVALETDEPGARGLLATLDRPLLVPALVAAEYLADHPQADEAYGWLARGFDLVHTSPEWTRAAAQWRTALRQEGRRIRTTDFWIGCWARLHGTAVVTSDRTDFESLGLTVIDWS